MAKVQLAAPPAAPWAGRRAGDDYGVPATPGWREVNWAPHVKQLAVAGRRVNYVDYGDSSSGLRPVVLVHGLGGCWQNWLEQIPRLAADGRRVIALDLPGFGASEMPADGVSIEGYGRCVEALCDSLDLGQVVIVGHSMGGFTAAEMAIQFPRRVERLVLEAAAGLSSNDMQREPVLAGARVVAALGARAATGGERYAVRPRLRWLVMSAVARYPSKLKADFVFEQLSHTGTDGFLPALEAIMAYDFRDRLSEVSCPTLILWGDKDGLVPFPDASQYEKLITGSRKVVFEDTGHSPMFERPQTFNDVLAEFLAEEREERPTEPEIEDEKRAAGGEVLGAGSAS